MGNVEIHTTKLWWDLMTGEIYLFLESGVKEIKMDVDAVVYKVTIAKLKVGKGAEGVW